MQIRVIDEKKQLESLLSFVKATRQTANDFFRKDQSVEMEIAQRNIDGWYAAMLADIKHSLKVIE